MATILRVSHDKEHPYVMVSRELIDDHGLTFQEKGLLIYLLSKPDDWRVLPEQLANENGISKASMYRLLNRLISSKYVYRDLQRYQEKGRWKSLSIYVVFEDKQARRDFLDRKKFAL